MNTLTIVLDNFACPSWNDVQTLHWSARTRQMSAIKGLAIQEIRAQLKGELRRVAVQLGPKVAVSVLAQFKTKIRRDPDNLYVKPIMDAIVFVKLLKDDNGDIVDSITLKSQIGMPRDKTIILIQPIEE